MTARPRTTSERTTRDCQVLDARHDLHPFTDFQALAREGSRAITRAEGVYLFDSDGQRILDGMSGLWCVNLGYSRGELADAAARQMRELPYYNSFLRCSNPPAIELARLLAELTPPQFNRVFFTNSGSEANDTIVRMTRRYWDLLGEPARSVIISRKDAYHGSTGAAASLGGMAAMHAQGGLPIPGIVHIEKPYWYENGIDVTPAEYGLRARLHDHRQEPDLGLSAAGRGHGFGPRGRRAGRRGRRVPPRPHLGRASGGLRGRHREPRHPAARAAGGAGARRHRPLPAIIAPPLVIEREQVDELVDRARRCLDLTAADLGAA